MVVDVVNSQKCTSTDPIIKVYGSLPSDSIVSTSQSPISVYIAGACLNPGTDSVMCGAGFYFGQNNKFNSTWRVYGPGPSVNRAVTMAVWFLVRDFPDRNLLIHTKSQFIVEALTLHAESNMKRNWTCANGDLLRAITIVVRGRSVPIHLILLQPQASNGHYDEALKLANMGA
ncbi:hypothetical protein BT96DRAFT_822408, partial [Gymnopus androsaceus JB14]